MDAVEALSALIFFFLLFSPSKTNFTCEVQIFFLNSSLVQRTLVTTDRSDAQSHTPDPSFLEIKTFFLQMCAQCTKTCQDVDRTGLKSSIRRSDVVVAGSVEQPSFIEGFDSERTQPQRYLALNLKFPAVVMQWYRSLSQV